MTPVSSHTCYICLIKWNEKCKNVNVFRCVTTMALWNAPRWNFNDSHPSVFPLSTSFPFSHEHSQSDQDLCHLPALANKGVWSVMWKRAEGQNVALFWERFSPCCRGEGSEWSLWKMLAFLVQLLATRISISCVGIFGNVFLIISVAKTKSSRMRTFDLSAGTGSS